MSSVSEREFVSYFTTYHRRLLVYVNKQLHDISSSEELVQDIMLEFAEDLRTQKKIEAVNAYLYGIARHKIADHFRKKKLKQILISALPEQLVNSCATLLFRDTVSQNELKDAIKRVLAKLPNDYALIIRLKYMEGMRVPQIAKVLSLSFKSAESMLFRARKRFVHMYESL